MTDIRTIADLEALYEAANPNSLLKEIDHINEPCARFIAASPFVVMSTSGPEGLDCSPRGDPAGFVRVVDPKTLLIPDRRGNNRLDSLRNIVRDPRIALLFMIPGSGLTLRVNGRAVLITDQALRDTFAMRGNAPTCLIKVTVETVYPQCPKAVVRSRLWEPVDASGRPELPSMGEMLQAVDASFDGKTYDAAYPARLKETIY
jgi:uncharacterized protein